MPHSPGEHCNCLVAYSNLVASLPSYPLLNVDFIVGSGEFGNCLGCDGIIESFLESGHETIKRVSITRGRSEPVDDPLHDYDLVETLNVLKDMPQLEDLKLHEVCSYSNLADLTWTCPLRRLSVLAFERAIRTWGGPPDVEDLSLALQGLPPQLQQLSLGSHLYLPERSRPFPPQFRNLRSLTLHIPLDATLLRYFCPCLAASLTIFVPASSSGSNIKNLADTIRPQEAFPKLKTLHIRLLSKDGDGRGLQEALPFEFMESFRFTVSLWPICRDRGILFKLNGVARHVCGDPLKCEICKTKLAKRADAGRGSTIP